MASHISRSTWRIAYNDISDFAHEHLFFLRGYGSGRRGKDNERDAATRPLRGRCAALRLQRTLNGRSGASFLVEVELFLSIGWSCRIREVGRFSRNRVVLVFDPQDGWFVVELWLEGRMTDGQDKDGYSADEGFFVGRTREKRTRIFL